MKHTKRLLALLLVAAMITFTFAACNDNGGTDNDDGVFQIGIIQIMEHPALDAAREGFINGLRDAGIEFEYDYHNAQGDNATMASIAQLFVDNDVDLILAVGTGAAVAAAAETQTIPIVGTAITSYTRPGLAETDEMPGFNITGASDFKPVAAQVAMISEFVPGIQTLGILYSSGEPNSVVQGELARETAAAMGWDYVVGTVTGTADVQQVTLDVASRVDAIYIPTDNTFAVNMALVGQISQDMGVPVFAAEANMVRTGGLATLSFSYYDLGLASARQAAMILRGEAVVGEIPIHFASDDDLFYIVNGHMAEQLGIAIPEQFHDYIEWPDSE
ncbi:MAG: ABC transporter substrate-binding protein [Oscillospiraceae bacterium]|nr:ABC transporter substrate-binding protein [Oscillospiraceae bacterium]